MVLPVYFTISLVYMCIIEFLKALSVKNVLIIANYILIISKY